MRNFITASCGGIALTLLSLATASAASRSGHDTISQILLWQNTVLQAMIPPFNIGTVDNPMYEGTPLNILAFFASVPLAFTVYSVLTYLVLRFPRRGT